MFISSKKFILDYLAFIIGIIISSYFRLFEVGYSDFRGDETKVFLFRGSTSFFDFILTNSKGPGQYVVVRLVDFINWQNLGVDEEFIYRLPFALAGCFSVFLIYHISKKFFGTKVAIIALFLSALNGLLIAFSRIVQYQSFSILVSLLSSLFFILFLNSKSSRFLVICSIFNSLGFLLHYDALSYIIPQILLILFLDYRIKNLIVYSAGLACSLIFYIPYLFYGKGYDTLKYLFFERAVTTFSYDSVFYGLKLSTIYFPKEYLLIVFGLIIVFFWRQNLKERFIYKSAMLLLFILLAARYIVESPYKPLIIISSFLALLVLYLVVKSPDIKRVKKYFAIWFIFAFTVYILILNKPLTHIYNVFVPLVFLASLEFQKIKSDIMRYLLMGVLLVSSISFNYQAYIESQISYPWEPKNYIFGEMYQGVAYGEVVRGIFGFPLYRGLDKLNLDMHKVVEPDVTPLIYGNIEPSRLWYYIDQNYPQNKRQEKYFIEVKEEKDKESNSGINASMLINLLETENYSIYKIL